MAKQDRSQSKRTLDVEQQQQYQESCKEPQSSAFPNIPTPSITPPKRKYKKRQHEDTSKSSSPHEHKKIPTEEMKVNKITSSSAISANVYPKDKTNTLTQDDEDAEPPADTFNIKVTPPTFKLIETESLQFKFCKRLIKRMRARDAYQQNVNRHLLTQSKRLSYLRRKLAKKCRALEEETKMLFQINYAITKQIYTLAQESGLPPTIFDDVKI